MKLTGWIFAAVLLLTLPFVGLQISERAEGLERRLTHERVAAGAKEKRLNEEIAARDRRIWELEKTQSALQVEIKKKQDAVDLAVIRAEKLAGERVKDRAEIEKIQAAANASPASALPQSSSPAAALTTAPEPTGLPAAPAPAALKPYIESLSKMMEDPAMKEPLQQKRAEDIAQQWAPFLEKIDPVVAQQFKEKQLVHLQKLLELGRAFTDGAATADRVTQYADAVKAAQDGLEDNLRSLLGPMGYERYQSYQKTIPMRSQIEMLKNYGFEVPDAAKKERLVTAMSEALQELNPQGCGTGAWPAVEGTGSLFDSFVKACLAGADPILDGAEKKAFQQALQRYRKTAELNAEVSALYQKHFQEEQEQVSGGNMSEIATPRPGGDPAP